MSWVRFVISLICGLLSLALVVVGIDILKESAAHMSTKGGILGTIMLAIGVGICFAGCISARRQLPAIQIRTPR